MEYDEFFKDFWFKYPKDLCHGKKGTKFNAQKACRKLKPEQYKEILMNMDALIRYDRKDMKPDRWPHASTFINQGYYDREIGSVAEMQERQSLGICSVEGCNQEVHGPSFKTCGFHIPNETGDMLKESWTRTGINFKSPTLIDECRAYCKERMAVMMGKLN